MQRKYKDDYFHKFEALNIGKPALTDRKVIRLKDFPFPYENQISIADGPTEDK